MSASNWFDALVARFPFHAVAPLSDGDLAAIPPYGVMRERARLRLGGDGVPELVTT